LEKQCVTIAPLNIISYLTKKNFEVDVKFKLNEVTVIVRDPSTNKTVFGTGENLHSTLIDTLQRLRKDQG
jgi:hypothetical protein